MATAGDTGVGGTGASGLRGIREVDKDLLSRGREAYANTACYPTFSAATVTRTATIISPDESSSDKVGAAAAAAVTTTVHVWSRKRDLEGARQRKFRSAFVRQTQTHGDDQYPRVGFPAEAAADEVASSMSPDGAYLAIFRHKKKEDNSSSSTRGSNSSIEVWTPEGLAYTLDTTKLHGAVYDSASTFGGFDWNQNNGMQVLLYAAEAPLPVGKTWWEGTVAGKASTAPSASTTAAVGNDGADGCVVVDEELGGKFAWQESWGEQHTEALRPRLFVLNVLARTARQLLADVPDLLANHSLGQPCWARVNVLVAGAVPAAEAAEAAAAAAASTDGRVAGKDEESENLAIAFVAWPSRDRRLGLKYYISRPSDIYIAYLHGTSLDTRGPPVRISGPTGSVCARSPRVNSKHTSLVYLSSPVGGPHGGGSELRWLKLGGDMPTLTDFDTTTTTTTTTTASSSTPASAAAKLVVPLADTTEPGLYCYQLPPKCFIGETMLLVDTPYGSRRVPILIDLALVGKVPGGLSHVQLMGGDIDITDGSVGSQRHVTLTADPADEDGACKCPPASWTVLYASDGHVVATYERPDLPPVLVAGNFNGRRGRGGELVKTLLCALTPVREMSKMLTFSVERHAAEPVHFESIVMTAPAVAEEADIVDFGHGDSVLPPPPPPPSERPLIVLPHGGPHSVIPCGFMPTSAAFVSMGFTVVAVNYRGSAAFGRAGINSLLGHIGQVDVADVNAAATAVIEAKLAHPDRVCVYGGSHGGFLAAHMTAQHPERFRVCAMRNPVIDMPSMAGVTDIPDWCFTECGLEYNASAARREYGPDVLANLFRASPISRVADVCAPTLVLIGAKDLRVPPSQGIIWHNTLRARGITTSVRWYPGECHPLMGVECEADTFISVLLWFKQFL